ncbi:MAG: prolipoprotein diacylglyceryl transferase family protein [Hydrogeniiclostridium mannosilyticum]
MLPAVEIFGFKVAMYGLLIVVGVGLGMAVAALRAKKNGQTAQDVLFGGIFAIIGLVIGAKLLYLATILPGIVRNFRIYWTTRRVSPRCFPAALFFTAA